MHLFQGSISIPETLGEPDTPRVSDSVPFHVNASVYRLASHWDEFFARLPQHDSLRGRFRFALFCLRQRRVRKERYHLEKSRSLDFRMVIDELTEKYKSAAKTKSLFEKLKNGDSPYVLLLREFRYRTKYFTGGSTGSTDDHGMISLKFRNEIARKCRYIPFVWISNPAGQYLRPTFVRQEVDDNVYRIDLGDNWERDVATLVEGASAIVVENSRFTPGLEREIEMVMAAGQLERLFFVTPCPEFEEKTTRKCQILDDMTFSDMELVIAHEALRLPPPTCRWLSGPSRTEVKNGLKFAQQMLDGFTMRKYPLHRDIQLDAAFFMLAMAMMLERLDMVCHSLSSVVELLKGYSERQLPERVQLLMLYGSYLSPLKLLGRHVQQDQNLLDINMDILTQLENVREIYLQELDTAMSGRS